MSFQAITTQRHKSLRFYYWFIHTPAYYYRSIFESVAMLKWRGSKMRHNIRLYDCHAHTGIRWGAKFTAIVIEE